MKDKPASPSGRIRLVVSCLLLAILNAPSAFADLQYTANEIRIIFTPDFLPIVWFDAQKYGVDFELADGELATLNTCNASTPCPQAAVDAGAVYWKVYSVPGRGNVTVYYDDQGNIVGTSVDPQGDSDGDGVADATDAAPTDPGQTTNEVGSIAGSFEVDPMGAANYSLPIEVPPGIAGMTPGLSLNYSSSGGNGPLGVGWSIGGLSVIHRCPRNQAQDNQVRGVDFSAYDRFCLDGQRLVAVSGAYGASGTTYYTEINNFSEIVSQGSVQGDPSYFMVRTKAGQTMEYGLTADAKVEAQGSSEILLWALNKITDAAGNQITFHYSEDHTNGEHSLSEVRYAYNGSSYRANIKFVYGDRADVMNGYFLGAKTKTSRRLETIKVYSAGSAIREYRLTYGANPENDVSRLERVTQCSLIGGTACLEPTVFRWSIPATQVSDRELGTRSKGVGFAGEHWEIDVNGDGRVDLVYNQDQTEHYYALVSNSDGTATSMYWGKRTGNTTYDKHWAMDVNGDGLTDLVYAYANDYRVLVNSGNSAATDQAWGTAPTRPTVAGVQLAGIMGPKVIDANGDGLDDLVYTDAGYEDSQFRIEYWVLVGARNGPATARKWTDRNHVIGFSGLAAWTIDVDGDGLEDVVYNEHGTGDYWALVNQGNGTASLENWGKRGHDVGFDGAHWPMDVNGDGLVDLVYNRDGSTAYWVFLNQGNGKAVVQKWGDRQHDVGFYGRHWPTDVNGDGMADLVYNRSGTSDYWVMKSKPGVNAPTVEAEKWATRDHSVAWNGSHWLLDTDGDGAAELVYNIDGSNSYRALDSAQQSDQIESIRDGFGNTADIAYKPLTDASVYDMGGSPYNVYPDTSVVFPLRVVAQTQRSDGIGGMQTTDYSYETLKVNKLGRGVLGFAKTQQTEHLDGDTAITTVIEYRQDFPHVGMVQSQVRKLNATPVSELSNEITHQGGYSYCPPLEGTACRPAALGYYFPHISSSESVEREIDGAWVKSTVTDTVFDTYGNATRVTVTTSGGGKTFTKTSVNDYYNDQSNWHLGRLICSAVTHGDSDGQSGTRVSGFEYNAQTGLLTREVIEPRSGDIAEPIPMDCVTQVASSDPTYGHITLITDYEHDTFGNIKTKTVSGPGIVTRASTTGWGERDLSGNVIPNGRFAITRTNAKGHEELRHYDPAFGAMTRLVGPNGLPTEWLYDHFGRKSAEYRADGTFTRWSYARCDGCLGTGAYKVTQTSSAKPPVTVTYDRFARKLRQQTIGFNGQSVIHDTRYDAHGRTDKVSHPYFSGETVHWTQYVYDDLGRLTQEIAPGTPAIQSDYHGLSTTVTNARGHATTQTNDALGRLVQVTDALLNNTYYRYDAFGNLREVEDGAGNLTQVQYDIRGRKTAMDDPDMGHWEYRHNALGELTWQRDAKSQAVTLEYDLLGRLKRRIEPEGTTQWTYDSAANGIGKLHTVTSPGGYLRSHRYTSLGLPESVSTTLDGTTYTQQTGYDGFSRPVTQTYPSGFVAHQAYNPHGYLERIYNADDTLTYWRATTANARGQITQETLGNGLTTTRVFDAETGYLKEIGTGTSAAYWNVQAMAFTFDDVGNLTARVDNLVGHPTTFNPLAETYHYDALNRLETADLTGLGATTYRYDAIGNLIHKSDVSNQDFGYDNQTGKPHAVKTAGGLLFSYDANGNLQTGAGRTLSYSSHNKPTRIEKGDLVVTFAYGADRARYKQVKTDATGTRTTYYVGLYEREVKSGLTTERHTLVAGGRRIALYTARTNGANDTRYLHTDHQGSLNAISDENGAVTERFSFDPFGKARSGFVWLDNNMTISSVIRTVTRRGYTGHEHLNDMGLIHMNGRVYDPLIGRFLSADPHVQAAANPQSLNRYSYVLNNPLSYTDPSGFFFKKLFKKVKRFVKKYGRAIVAAVAAYFTFGAVSAWASNLVTSSAIAAGVPMGAWGTVVSSASMWGAVVGGAAAGFVAGGLTTGSIKGALYGAVGGAIGGAFAGGGILGRATGSGINGYLQTGDSDGFWRGFASGAIPQDLGLAGAYRKNAAANISIGVVRDGLRGYVVGGKEGVKAGIALGQLNNATGHLWGAISSDFSAPQFRDGAFYYPDSNRFGQTFGYHAITFGNVITGIEPLYTGDLTTKYLAWLDLHERGHIPQGNAMGALYLPLHAVSQWTGWHVFEYSPWHPLGYETAPH